MPTKFQLCTGVAALLLVGVSPIALAQNATPPQQVAAPVTASEATHVAQLTGANPGATGTAFFAVNTQDNSLRWTIEIAGMEATSAARVSCPPTGVAGGTPAPNGAAAPPQPGATPAASAEYASGSRATWRCP
jgi:hypothetical protein